MRTQTTLPIIALTAMFLLPWPVLAAEPAKPLTLTESIAIARQNSMAIRSAREGVAIAEAQHREASTGFLPKFSTSYGYTLLNTDPSFMFPGIPPLLPAATMTTGTRDNYTWAFEVKQPLFAGGAILENYRSTRLGVESSGYEEQTKVLDTILQVKTAYVRVLKAERLREVAQQSVELLNAHLQTAQGYYEVHMIPRNDVLRAEVELANGRKNLLKADNGLAMAGSSFNTILRRDINAPVSLVDILGAQPPVKTLDDCLKAAQANRPEIRAYTLRVRQGEHQVGIVRSEYFPNLNAVGHFERYGDDPTCDGSDYKDKESWYVAAVATWNFWEWGKTRDRVDAGRARVNQLDAALVQIQDQIQLEVKDAWLALEEAKQQVVVTRKAIEQAEENYRISRERYKEQVGTSTDVLDAQTLLTRAKAEYADALGDCHIAYARLERAMGIINAQEG